MAEIYPNIVTKVQINETVLPYSSEDATFNSSVMETLTFDVKPKFGDELFEDLIANGYESGATFSENTQEWLDAGGRLAIMYYVVARTLRKTVTPTRFGSTVKVNSEMTSEQATNSQIVSQSGYYKEMADDLVKQLLQTFKPVSATQSYSYSLKAVGE